MKPGCWLHCHYWRLSLKSSLLRDSNRQEWRGFGHFFLSSCSSSLSPVLESLAEWPIPPAHHSTWCRFSLPLCNLPRRSSCQTGRGNISYQGERADHRFCYSRVRIARLTAAYPNLQWWLWPLKFFKNHIYIKCQYYLFQNVFLLCIYFTYNVCQLYCCQLRCQYLKVCE